MKYALRQLAKSPGFTLVAILILALGIGFSASSFSVANLLLLRDVPYPEPDRLVRLFSTSPDTQTGGHAPGTLFDLRKSATSFSGMAMFNGDRLALGQPGQPAEQVMVQLVSTNFFDVLGTPMLLGRGFRADEDQPGASNVVVLPYTTWAHRYGSDPAILGQTVRLDTQPRTVVGILPPGFDAPMVWGPAEFFCPRQTYPGMDTQRNGSRWMQAFARLKPGVSFTAAQSELNLIAGQLAHAYPKDNAGRGLRLTSLHDSNINSFSRNIAWLGTAFSVAMMLIACANLASLQVARALGRQRDFAVRAALGGSRRQLMGPLLAEGLLLAVAGGAAGLLVSVWTNAIIGRFLNLGFGPGTTIPFDGRVLAFAAGSALLSGLAFSLLPAWLSARTSAADALKENARGSSGGRGQQRLKNVLMIGQIAAALVSITISFAVGLKSFVHRDTGWRMDNLFTGDVVLPAGTYDKPARRNAFTRALLDRLTALPGVDHAALAGSLPLFYFGGASPVIVEGRPADAPGHEPVAYSAAVTSDYFSTLGIPLEKGAVFAPHLTADDPPVAIINASFARQFWPGTSPIGHRFRLGADEPWLEIVGVVGDVQIATGLSPQASRLQLYRPLVQAGNRYFTIALHSSTLAPAMLVKTVLATVATLDGDLPVSNAGSVTARLESAFSNNDLIIVNFSISAGMGLLIAAIGLSGVISQLVQQRRRDIGIRLALGAVSANILRLLLGEGLKLLAAGLVLGVAGYYALHAVLHRAMSEVQFPGLWLLAINLAILSAVMAVACYLPARRATKVDPLTALRAE